MVVEKIKEVLLAGRGSNLAYIREKMIRSLNDVAPVRIMNSFSQIAKRAEHSGHRALHYAVIRSLGRTACHKTWRRSISPVIEGNYNKVM